MTRGNLRCRCQPAGHPGRLWLLSEGSMPPRHHSMKPAGGRPYGPPLFPSSSPQKRPLPAPDAPRHTPAPAPLRQIPPVRLQYPPIVRRPPPQLRQPPLLPRRQFPPSPWNERPATSPLLPVIALHRSGRHGQRMSIPPEITRVHHQTAAEPANSTGDQIDCPGDHCQEYPRNTEVLAIGQDLFPSLCLASCSGLIGPLRSLGNHPP